jgi:hypothetical protein
VNDAIESIQRNGCTIEVFYDHDCSSPREDDCGNFLFLGFPHRNYGIGDETLDPREHEVNCPKCDSAGVVDDEEHQEALCDHCGGTAAATIGMFDDPDDYFEAVSREFEGVTWRRVGMIDHSGVAYYLGGGAHACDPGGWDSGTCGILIATESAMAERFGHDWHSNSPKNETEPGWATSPLNEAFIIECMEAEIGAYSDWANGNCYGYVVTDVNGDEIDSCWGFIGDYDESGLMERANDSADRTANVAPLFEVRLTAPQITATITAVVAALHDEVCSACEEIVAALRSALPKGT